MSRRRLCDATAVQLPLVQAEAPADFTRVDHFEKPIVARYT
jgi:hypothetical protein